MCWWTSEEACGVRGCACVIVSLQPAARGALAVRHRRARLAAHTSSLPQLCSAGRNLPTKYLLQTRSAVTQAVVDAKEIRFLPLSK